MKEKESHSLLKLLKKEKRKIKKGGKKFLSCNYLYVPSLKSFLFVFGLVLIFFLLSHCVYIGGKIDFNNNHYQNLIVILAGIGTLIFALIIFTAESSRNDQTSDHTRVLLRENFLFPLTVGEILTFFVFIWGDVGPLSVIPVFFIGIFSIISLWKTLSIMLNKYKFSKKRIELLKERLSQSIDKAINERIGNIIFLNKLDGQNFKLKFYPFSPSTSRDRLIHFRAERPGVITDVNLKKLKEFSDKLEAHANENGFSYEPEIKKELPEFGYNVEKTSPEGEAAEAKVKAERYILKKFYDQVTPEQDILISVDKDLVNNDKIKKKLNNIFKKIFEIESQDNFSEEIRHELEGVKDQFISAITDKKLGRIKEYNEIYKNLAESFLENMDEIGEHYSYSAAQKERSSLFGGWTEVRWILSDISDIYRMGIKSYSKDIIHEISYLPISIIHSAINFYDHYLFQEFIQLHPLLYNYALNEKEKDIKNLMIDLSWRYLKEISDFIIEPKMIREDLTEDKLLSLKDYMIHILYVFKNLLKEAFDKGDIESFKKFRDVVLKLLNEFEYSRKAQYLKDKKEEPAERGNKQKFLEDIHDEIDKRRKQMLFGLTSYIFDKFRNKNTDGRIKIFYNEIKDSVSNSLIEFTEVFLNIHQDKISKIWQWSRWYYEPDGEVHSIPIPEVFERFYVVRALEFLESEKGENINQIQLPYNRDLVYMVEGARDLVNTINDISENKKKWEFVLSESAVNKIPKFKELLQKAKVMEEERTKREKRIKKISELKINQFKENFLKNYYAGVILRRILEFYKLYENKIDLKNDDIEFRFGTKIIDDKAAFFDEWYVHFHQWGAQYGRNMASGENRAIFKDLISWCKKSKNHTIENILRKIEPISNAFIIAHTMAILKYFENYDSYIPEYNLGQNKESSKYRNLRNFIGFYVLNKEKIPVFEYNFASDENAILILNRAKLGKLIQYSPLLEGEKIANLKDKFFINIQACSDNRTLLEQLIRESPEWLQTIGNKEQQELHLLEKVLIQIFQKFEFKKHPEFEGYLLKL